MEKSTVSHQARKSRCKGRAGRALYSKKEKTPDGKRITKRVVTDPRGKRAGVYKRRSERYKKEAG
jgi:hypothetical protein